MHSVNSNTENDKDLVVHVVIPAKDGEADNLRMAAAALGCTVEHLLSELYVYAMSYPPDTFVQWYHLRKALLS